MSRDMKALVYAKSYVKEKEHMEFELRQSAEQLCIIMERIYDMDLTSLTGGNVSLMDDEGIMWVTPTSIDKKSLTPDDIVKVLPDGTIVGKHKPTSEYYIHRMIMLERPDIKAVIHAHAPATVTMSVLKRIPLTDLYQSAYNTIGSPVMTPYVLPGSMKLAEVVKDVFVAGHDVVMLEKHSAFVGSTKGLTDAFVKFEALDFACRTEINAQQVGKLNRIDCHLLKKQAFPDVNKMEEYVLTGHCSFELKMRKVLQAILKRGYQKKLFMSQTGVMSVRIDENCFLIPEADTDNGNVSLEQLTVVKGGMREKGKMPNSLAGLHQMIYDRHPEVKSVIMAAPVYTMGFLVTNTLYDTTLYPESYGVLRETKRYRFESLFDQVEEMINNLTLAHPMAMIEHWGILLVGPNPILTFDKLEVCESGARSIHEGKCMGLQLPLMTENQIKEMNDVN